MKKKILILTLLFASIVSFSACGKQSNGNISDYLIEERNNLFIATDNNYSVTLSSGKRESNYAFDGVINEKIDFAILSISRLDGQPLTNDSYNYNVTIGENSYTGNLEKVDNNTYSADLELCIADDFIINTKIDFTGYSFNQNMENISNSFAIQKDDALKIANEQIGTEVQNLIKANTQVEVVMKILKDYSSGEIKNYYWYVGSISTEGDTLGVLINASSGEVVAKKV